ncbi:MAG TPA: protein-disulfide reductase DsbD domain-containing protein [Kofleriaceae bacterium]|nr:protein-disulfide reductase DsbD domain-containing protein [Kofleriaceae bacterium]
MSRPAATASLALLALAAGSAPSAAQAPAGPAPAARPPQQKAADLVKVELVADATGVSPGKPITLAMKFTIATGWHIYWENPGEAGLATEVAFAAPAGYEIGPVRYPGPDRFQTPGETAASFGYAGSALLSSSVTGPRAASAAGPLRFSAEATYLVCRDMCIRGQGKASLELPLASRAQPARPANAALFRRHRAELPRRQAELGATPRWERDARGVRLVLAIKRADRVEYFPPTGEDLNLVGQKSAGASGKGELQLDYKPGFKPAHARGVVAVTDGAERRFYALDLEEKP